MTAVVYCDECAQRIPESVPDLVLEAPDLAGRLHFHSWCSGAALDLIADEPGVFAVVVRRIYVQRN